VVVQRSGGAGDVIMAIACFGNIIDTHPEATFRTFPPFVDVARAYLSPALIATEELDEPTSLDLDGVYESMWQLGHPTPPLVAFCQAAGCPVPSTYPRPYISDDAVAWANGILEGNPHPKIAVGFWSDRQCVMWDINRWIELFRLLPEYVFVLLHAHHLSELPTRRGSVGSMAGEANVLDITGQTNFNQMLAAIQRCDLVISIDTLHAHIASSLGKPLIYLGGGHILSAPPGQAIIFKGQASCYPCYATTDRECGPGPHCLGWVTSHMVATTAKGSLENG